MISVVGGAGFIGTRLCQILMERRIPFEIIDLKKSRRFSDQSKIADIREYAALKEAVSGDTIIHLAAVHRDDVRDHTEYYTTNVDGTRNICQVAADQGIRTIVFTSSVAVYGFAQPNTAENGAVNPFNDYGRSKFEAETVLREWFVSDEQNRNLTIVRPTVVFGEGNRGNVYNLLKQMQSGRFMMVGSGHNRKSMAYVGNVAAFLEFAAGHIRGFGLYNYVDKPDFDMNDLVSKVNGMLKGDKRVGLRLPYTIGLGLGYLADVVARVAGLSLPISSIRVRKFCANTSFMSAAQSVPGFQPPFSLQDGLEKTIRAEFIDPSPESEIFFTK